MFSDLLPSIAYFPCTGEQTLDVSGNGIGVSVVSEVQSQQLLNSGKNRYMQFPSEISNGIYDYACLYEKKIVKH